MSNDYIDRFAGPEDPSAFDTVVAYLQTTVPCGEAPDVVARAMPPEYPSAGVPSNAVASMTILPGSDAILNLELLQPKTLDDLQNYQDLQQFYLNNPGA